MSSITPAATPAAVPTIPQAPTRVLVTVKQLCELQPALTEGGVRWDLYNQQRNGLAKSGAIIRRGRRILIDPERYLGWLESRSEVSA